MNFIKKWVEERARIRQLAKAPKNIGDAVLALDAQMDDENRSRFAKEQADHPGSQFHFVGGMAMRNNWGLWDKEQPLTKWFRERGIWHADDMSACIYKAYWCFLNDVSFNIIKEAIAYEQFWKETGLGFDGETLNK